ncbi:unnamed protein product [Zymoseptoria tritici ST99CH_3D1]|nr:unnamed protein product [Zymoseptoria tritici ST99CH_3D1]
MSGAGANYDYPPHHHHQPVSAEQQPPPQMALPSIQHFDAQSQQQQQQQQPPPPAPQQHYAPPPYNPATMLSHAQHPQHPPPYPPVQYQYHTGAVPPPAAPMQSASGQNGMMRYPIPPQASLESRQMSGGHSKKEIKRRTKTGCITCRKRRIKCDEAQPTCRNCQKSKRECMGYDPVFKQTPQPAPIQPAPNPPLLQQQHSTAHHHHLHQQSPLPPPPHHLHQQPPPPPPSQQQLHQSPSIPHNPYQSAPSYPGTGGAFGPAPIASYPTGAQSHQDYQPPSLDPALSTASPQQQNMAHNNYPPSLQPQRDVKSVSMEDLFSLHDVPPRYREGDTSVIQAVGLEVIDTSFKYHYASGLDRLFETTWYSQRGFAQLREDAELQSYFIQCMEQMSSRDESAVKATMSMEARLVWLLASLPRTAAYRTNGAGLDPLLQELLPRIDTVEHLLTGQFLDPGRVPSPAQASPPMGQPQEVSASDQKYNERSFWHHLARFVSIRDDQPSALKGITDSLNAIRAILNMLETRDVLYSLAIARHVGGRLPDFPQRQLMATNNDPNDDINKLMVANGFIQHEEQRGQSQVFQRICSMALRSWMLQKQR